MIRLLDRSFYTFSIQWSDRSQINNLQIIVKVVMMKILWLLKHGVLLPQLKFHVFPLILEQLQVPIEQILNGPQS